MKRIPLTHGKYALVDDEDYEELTLFRWHAIFIEGNWYARFIDPEEGLPIYMSRFIMGFPDGLVYHANHNGLDNRKANFVIYYADQRVKRKRKRERAI